MTGIQSNTGLATGIDISGTVDKLMQIESKPRDLLKSRLADVKAQQTAITDLTASVIGIQLSAKTLGKAETFAKKSVTSSNTALLTAAVSSSGGATPGTYQITPYRQATSQQLLAGGISSTSAALGAGTFTLRDGASSLNQAIQLSELNGGVGVERGKIRITDRSGATAVVDLRYVQTIDDVLSAINSNETINVSARASGDRIVLTDNTGQTSTNLKVQEVGGGKTASQLGLAGIDVASSTASGGDIVKLFDSLSLGQLKDGNGLSFNDALADLRVTFRDGSSPVDIDFHRLAKAATQPTATLHAASGVNGDLQFTALTNGDAYDGVQVKFIDSGSVTKGQETVAYDANAKTLTFDIQQGSTTASDVVAALNANSSVHSQFVAQTTSGGNGSGLIATTDTATTSGGAALAARSESTLAKLIQTINEAAPSRLKAELSADGDRIVLTDLTANSGGSFSVSSLHGGTLAEELGLAKSTTSGTLSGGKLLAGLNTTLLSSLNGGRGLGTLGALSITDRSGAAASVNLANAETVDDVLNAINGAGIGVRAEVNSSGSGIRLLDTTGSTTSNLIVASGDATNTATKLGLAVNGAVTEKVSAGLTRQSVSANTLLTDFNRGKGVVLGSFTITDSTGATSAINLSTLQAKSVGDVIDAINSLSIGVEAKINDTGDGIALIDTAGGAGKLTVVDVGTGKAAQDLKIAGQSTSGTLAGQSGQIIDGSTAIKITLDADDSLSDLVTKINDASGGVTASIFTDGSGSTPYRLSLSSGTSGDKGNWVVDGSSIGLEFSEVVKGQDSIAAVGANGSATVLVSSSTNVIKNAVAGVDVTLKGSSSDPVTVTVSQDVSNITSKVKTFVDSYNKLIDKLKKLDYFDADARTKGTLFGSSETLRIRSDITRVLTNRFTGLGKITNLQSLGVSFKDDGSLDFDSSKLEAAYNQDSDSVTKFFSQTETGFSAKLDQVIEQLAGRDNSVLINRNIALQRQVDTFNQRIDAWSTKLDTTKERLLNQFYTLESTISKLKNTYSSVESSLASSASLYQNLK